MKRRGVDQKGAWDRETAGTISLGGGGGGGGGLLIQRAAIGPTEQVGFRSGLKGPKFFWPKPGPDRKTKTQKALGGRIVNMGPPTWLWGRVPPLNILGPSTWGASQGFRGLGFHRRRI